MRRSLVELFLVLASIFDVCLGVKFLLTVPKVACYDSNLVASVSAFGLAAGQTEVVTLEYRGATDSSKLLNSTSLEFTSDSTQTWNLVFPWERMEQLDETEVQIIMLGSNGDKVSKNLPFSKNFGFIFIQTDKPVYTPRQTMKFRVIAVDEYQRLAKYNIRIDIRNPKLIVIDRMRLTAEEAFKAKAFELPKDTPLGEWSITANFEGVDQTLGATNMVKFEVKEYVLPRFSSTISVYPVVITKGTEWVTVNITSRYVYGRPLFGRVDMQLGIWQSGIIYTHPTGYTEELVNGQFIKDIQIGSLLLNSLAFSGKSRLYIKATVTESASMESYTYEDTSAYIAHPYYVIDFTPTKKFFRPGLPYTLQAKISAQDGRPASNKPMFVVPMFFNSQQGYIGGQGVYISLNQFGEMNHNFNVPDAAVTLNFSLSVLDPEVSQFERFSLTVNKFDSPNNKYIHISVISLTKKYQDGAILLRYTIPNQSGAGFMNKQDIITVLILARGHVIFTTTTTRNRNGQTTVPIPSRLHTEITPSIRIVAYYHVQSDTPELVLDSLHVDTPNVCLEELSLMSPGGSTSVYKPKETYILEVYGGPNMNVGFVAVDKAVFFINDKPTLTRDLMFHEFASHDRGTGNGDGYTAEEILENSGLHHLIIDLDQNKKVAPSVSSSKQQGWKINEAESHIGGDDIIMTSSAPPQTVRNYFPESWYFNETKLSRTGSLNLNLTLPDTITTWSFMAVGISSNRGVCVSRPFEQRVLKLFFADVRLPYKVTRLEEVKVKIAVYNYQIYAIQVKVVVTGSDGLCFSANTIRGNTKNSTSFTMMIDAMQSKGETIKVIPLRNGDLTLKVELESQNEKDAVEKQLYVVAEGQRIKKSITFVLDPEAKHATYRSSKSNKTKLYETSTINNTFDLKNREQKTRIDLALPSNIIQGTESCRISAFGDLMGDIITHAVIESRNLIDPIQIGIMEVLSDLAPTIHALTSITRFGFMDDSLQVQSRKFLTNGIAKLTGYHHISNSFTATPLSKPSTRLTAFALKTLCHASSMVYVQKENLIDKGFDWLTNQMNNDGSLKEQDPVLIQMSLTESKILLSAEVLIAAMECNRTQVEPHFPHLGRLPIYLKNSLPLIKDPLVLAKVTYALMLFDHTSEETETAAHSLLLVKKKTKQNHCYWSKVQENDEAIQLSHWFQKEPHASAIEATAYALMVYLKKGGTNVDSIADWLVGQRNYNGAFVGAMDSTAAIQALSEYSFQKHVSRVNLHCNVSSDDEDEYFHFFKFTEKNAIHRESLNDVPIGRVLDVLTRGHGLGQMQVNVEYNIPIDKNQKCQFRVTVNISKTIVRWSPDMQSNPLCTSCNIGCLKPVDPARNAVAQDIPGNQTVKTPAAGHMTIRVPKPCPKGEGKEKCESKKNKTKVKNKNQRNPNRKEKTGQRKNKKKIETEKLNSRQKRAVENEASRKSICVHVCLQYLPQGHGPSAPAEIRIEMLTGYQPVAVDLERMRNTSNVRHVEYDSIREVIVVQFLRVPCTEKTCLAFRAVDEGDAGRLAPANVEVVLIGAPAPQCVMEYHGLPDDESLQVYCADISRSNRGECRCYSGLCSLCKPSTNNDPDFDMYDVKQLVCNKPIVYQLQIASTNSTGNWLEINSKVISVNKTGIHNIGSGSIIKMMTPTSCTCPLYQYQNTQEKFYLLSADVEKLVDRDGNYVYRYLLDEQSLFLKIADPGVISTPYPSVPHFYLKQALSDFSMCEK